MPHHLVETDLLIIGGGLAGAYAALSAVRGGAVRVTLVTRGALEESNSAQAQGGIAAALAAGDDPDQHAADTLAAGAGLCHPEAVAVLTQEGPGRVRELRDLGVPFAGEPGLEGGHRRRRIWYTPGSRTGREIMAALLGHLYAAAGAGRLQVITGARLTALAVGDGRCQGAWFRLETDPGAPCLGIAARATLLATGGAAGLFPFSTNPPAALGEGIAAAYLAGAAVADMEFVQFHPTALRRAGGSCLLISEAVRGEGAWLLNARGERFMPAVHPMAELAPRDVVARAVLAEMERLGGPVFLSLRHLPAERVYRRFPFLAEVCRQEGLDLARDPVPVAPAAHYLCGGVWSDLSGRTTLPGLWVAGEAACTGVHGANRLASNSLLECVVFGARAVTDILAGGLAPRPPASLPPPAGPAVREEMPDLECLRREVGRGLGPVRHRGGLEALLRWLEDLPPSLPATCAWLMARGALSRTESRGCHHRTDAPVPEPEPYRIVQRQGMAPVRVPIAATPQAALPAAHPVS